MSELTRVISTELALPVADRLPGLLAPNEMSLQFKAAFRKAVQALRNERGEVTGEEDVYPLVRAVQGFQEKAAEYAAAFKLVADDAKAVHLDELTEVRGETNGIPNGSLWVPDERGTFIKIAPKTAKTHHVDADSIVCAVATWLAAEWDKDPDGPGPDEAPEAYAIAVARRVLELMGSQTMQISKAEKLIGELQVAGEIDLAATVQTAVRTTVELKDVTSERVTEDQMKRSRAYRESRKAS